MMGSKRKQKPLGMLTFVGQSIESAVSDAIDKARATGRRVHFRFNDRNLKVHKRLSVDHVLRQWRASIGAASLRYNKRPDVIERRRLQAAAHKAKQQSFDRQIARAALLDLRDSEAWKSFVTANQSDAYSQRVVSYAEDWGRLMQLKIAEGASLADCYENSSREADTDGVTGFMYACAKSILFKTWVHGEELKALIESEGVSG